MGTILVCLILAAVVFFAVRSLVKKGKPCCGSCDKCSGCHGT